MIQKLFLLCVGIATIALVLPYALAGHWLFALIIALGGLFWWYGWSHKLPGISTLYLLGVTAFCVLGVWINLVPFYFLASLLAALTAWDLDRFDQRLNKVDRVELKQVVVRKHLIRLLFVVVLGLLVGGAALLLRFNLTFGWVLILGLVTVLGLSQVYNLFKREINKQ